MQKIEKITAILQGRMGSTRLPHKVLLPLMGKPIIQNVYERLIDCSCVDQVVVATTTSEDDDAIARHFLSQGVQVFRGSPEDPLDRYFKAARHFKIKHILRAMADCPLIDPPTIDEIASLYFSGAYNFCHLVGEFPTGLDTTIFSFESLEKAWRYAARRSEREHVTPYMTNNPNLFNIGTYEPFKGLYHHRWVVDHPEDYEFVKAVYAGLENLGRKFKSKDVINFLNKHPEIMALNNSIPRDQGYKNLTSKD